MRRSADPSPGISAQETWRLPCLENDADLWFAQEPGAVETAKALCRGCRVRRSCLATALERAEVHGVWGGELVIDGVVVPYKRGPGRPRKHPIGTVA